MALIFVARWFPRPEKKAEFVAALNELGASMPPTLRATATYVNICWNRRGEFIACESWKDEAAINAFRESPGFHKAIRLMSACCSRPLELEILDEFAGDGSVFERYRAGTADPRYYPPAGALTATVV
jgi:quinol monooxygenase YgiN